MFTTLASYLRGGLPSAVESHLALPGAVTAQVRLTAVDADDDWVLVDKSTDDAGECGASDCEEGQGEACSCVPSLEVAISAIPALLLPAEQDRLTRSSSASSLPCLSLEESWFVTPPPCFTSGPVHMETSPLENLLIEHPSMSVYQHSAPPRQRPRPTDEQEQEPPAQEPAAPALDQPRRQPARRQAVYSLQQQQHALASIRSAQKIRQRRASQVLKRNHLERSNKAREACSRNKQMRRSDHMLNHSGANNNRKC